MRTEYRITCVAVFDTDAEREKMYAVMKQQIVDVIKNSGLAKSIELTKDDYAVPEYFAEKLV